MQSLVLDLQQHPQQQLSIISAIKKGYHNFLKLREANKISSHFSEYFLPMLAMDESLRYEVFNIRHRVYCEELHFEPIKDDELEQDEFDAYSIHCLLKHVSTNAFAGTVRIVRPKTNEELLPIEKFCSDSITHETLHPKLFPREQICELSRLAVPLDYRRRKSDQFNGAATGVINQDVYSESELRCFPFIAVGLYLAAASTVLNHNITHTYVMMEPRLARSMSFIGIKFEKIGPTIDYHGQRAPYYINPHLFFSHLSPGFKSMFNNIIKQLEKP